MKKIFTRIAAALLALISVATVLVSCSAPTPDEVMGAVNLPDTYYIEYEVKDKDGVIRTVSKAVDENGSVVFRSGDELLVFIKDGESYTEYSANGNGELTSEVGRKVTEDYVEEATAEFNEYAERSREKLMPTVKVYGETTVADRACTVYSVTVGIKSFNVGYYYYVDDATGVCLGFNSEMVLANIALDTDDTVFTCVTFTTEVPKIEK